MAIAWLDLTEITFPSYQEPTEVIRGDVKGDAAGVKENVNLSSGFTLAGDISHAVDLIEANPVGPERPAKK